MRNAGTGSIRVVNPEANNIHSCIPARLYGASSLQILVRVKSTFRDSTSSNRSCVTRLKGERAETMNATDRLRITSSSVSLSVLQKTPIIRHTRLTFTAVPFNCFYDPCK